MFNSAQTNLSSDKDISMMEHAYNFKEFFDKHFPSQVRHNDKQNDSEFSVQTLPK